MTISKKPYLLRAFYDWMVDSGMTPYLLVDSTVHGVEVPQAFVSENGEIVLDISIDAVRSFSITRQSISFEASFPGQVHALSIPVAAVIALYSNETEEGVYFDDEDEQSEGLLMAEIDMEGDESPISSTPLSEEQSIPKRPVFTVVEDDD